MKRAFATVLVLLAATGALAQKPAPPRKAAAARPNVLLITIDTLRADRVGCYGYKEIKTPAIDGLCRDGIVFDRAIAQVPLTWPSHVAILTGTYPFWNGVQDFTGQPLRLGVATLPTGAFYALANARAFTADSLRFAFDILEATHVAVTPGVDFGRNAEGYLRFAYANSVERIEQGSLQVKGVARVQVAINRLVWLLSAHGAEHGTTPLVCMSTHNCIHNPVLLSMLRTQYFCGI